MKRISPILLALCLMLGICGAAYGSDYASYIDSNFQWGMGVDDYIAINLITDYEIQSLTETVSIVHETINENEYEDSVFINGLYVGGIYDVWASAETTTDDLILTLDSLFGYHTEGGGERMFAIMNTLVPGLYSSPDEFTDCVYAEIPEKGYFGCVCSYTSGSYVLAIVNENLLFSLSGAEAPAAAPADTGSATIGGGLNGSGTETDASGASIGGGLNNSGTEADVSGATVGGGLNNSGTETDASGTSIGGGLDNSGTETDVSGATVGGGLNSSGTEADVSGATIGGGL